MIARFVEVRDGVAVFQIGALAHITFVANEIEINRLKRLGDDSLVNLLTDELEFVWYEGDKQQSLQLDLQKQDFEQFLIRSGRLCQ